MMEDLYVEVSISALLERGRIHPPFLWIELLE